MINSLILREEQTLIEKNFSDSVDYSTIYLKEDFEVSDTFLNEIVIDLINAKEYKNIFIPLCFGSVISDFNGLRLAAHIRCTPGINQSKNIYIFSFVNIDFLINNECFDILKTKGVQLIKYNFYTIQALLNNFDTSLILEDLPNEIKKLNLQIPSNYEDKHSIANEWAIYRWSQTIDAKDDNIEKIEKIQKSNLYFKYLKTIYPISNLDSLNPPQIKINFQGQPKVLYIDDEADKGWAEIFCQIIDDSNGIDFNYLGNELQEKNRDEIIQISLEKIIKDDIDIVILDFRLHNDDFDNNNVKEVTGYQILKKIKEYNKGIQVIIFSATNKIWNLQALQDAGADDFIIKEGPENGFDSEFTRYTIENFERTLTRCINKVFLKNIYFVLSPLIEKVEINSAKKPKNYHLTIPQGNIIDYFDYLKSADFLLYSNPNNLKYCFLQLILIIEDIIKSFYVNSYNGNHYVKLSLTEQILCLDKSGFQIKLKLKPLNKWNRFSDEDYAIEGNKEEKMFNVQADRIPFNYRLNCVLYFKYNIDLQISSKYSSLYKLRSSSVAHIGNSEVNIDSILNTIELLTILIK